MFRRIAGFHHVPGDSRLDDGCQVVADGQRPPRCVSGECHAGSGSTVAIVLLGHGEHHGVESVGRGVAQVRGTVAAVHTGLADECPVASADVEEPGEGVAVSVLRTFAHRGIRLVALFVAGLRTFPAYHGVALWSQEGRGALGKVKAGGFPFDDDASRLAEARQFVAECHVVVAHAEDHVERTSRCILQADG